MPETYDVIIVGSGPAGVSAAMPLVQEGLEVLMVDGGYEQHQVIPSEPYLSERYQCDSQWEWMVGKDYHSMKFMDAASPKLRVPAYRFVFQDFVNKNHIEPKGFVAVGSLASGGLSNAWGCGVARLSTEELESFPFPEANILQSYEAVSRRIGISGANDDDLSGYFGLDSWSQPAIAMDALHQRLFSRYLSLKRGREQAGFRLGRSRVAALSRDIGDRKACDLLGNCLWGCQLKALYSSADEMPSLARYSNFRYLSGMIVDGIKRDSNNVTIESRDGSTPVVFSGRKLVLAAGTLATTRLAMQALGIDRAIRLQSCPTAAFLLWLPAMLGSRRTRGFGLGQLSYALELTDGVTAFGSTFSTTGIPVTEFVRHLPLRSRYGIDLLRHLLSSCVVGNLFLPGYLSETSVSLDSDGTLHITGGYADRVTGLMSEAARRLRRSYWRLGAWLLPMSFTEAQPGSDIHYSSTLPMRSIPGPGETDVNGQLAGFADVHVADGACLPILTEKSHTLTIMANADRIGRELCKELRGRG